MNEPASQELQHRHGFASRFSAQVSRYRSLLRRRWWVPILTVALAVAVQAVILKTARPAYSSVSRMIVNIKLSIPEGSVYNEELSNFLGTQASIMQSGTVINRAHARVTAQKPELVARPVGLRVAVTPKTSIFVLQASGVEPQYTQAFLQACMEEYIRLKKEMREQTSSTTLAGLTEEVLRLEKELRNCDQELAAFQGTNSVVLLQEQGNSAGSYLAALNKKMADLKSEHDLLTTLTLDQNLARQSGQSALSLAGSGDDKTSAIESDYAKAKQQLLVLKAEQMELGRVLRPKHPKMIAMTDEIARRGRLLEILKSQSVEELESKKISLALQMQNLAKDIAEWDAKNLEISRQTAEYQKLKSNGQRIQALYDRLLGTMQTLDVNKEISPESVTIMEPASPAFLDGSNLVPSLQKAALIGLGLSLVLLFIMDRLDDRISSFTELQEIFDESVLGQIPRERRPAKGAHLPLIQTDDPRHPFVESYRNLRSSLLYLAQSGQRPRIIALTSAVPSEGKSMTAANLAITMALTGSRVLLVDADLRKGVVHQRFGLNVSPGLSQVLAQGLDWSQAVQATSAPNLSVIPRGETCGNASELFLSERSKEFLKAAAEKFDWVLIDTAPVLAADDVTSLAPLIEGVIFILRAEHTSARVARAALDLLYQRQANVLGFVFNAVRSTSGDYYYYYRYRDYYRTYPAAK